MNEKLGLIYQDCLASGGYPRDVRWLASALSACGASVTIFAKEGWVTEGLDGSVQVEPLENIAGADVDIYHFFGVLLPRQLALMRKVLGRPVVVSPMGHLMRYHLGRKGIKKKVYLQIVKPLLRRVRWFHSFAPPETESIRQYLGVDVHVFEASLGVFPAPSPNAFSSKRPIQNEQGLKVLFFGRNDIYHKGIDVLLEGFARAIRNGARASLAIAGKPWGDSERYIKSFTKSSRLERAIQCLGPVDEGAKYRLLAEADYLVFLSRWDGPPRPIREAIAVGTPVIVSPETNMGSLVEEYEAGLEVPLNPDSVAEAIARVAVGPELRESHRKGAARLRERLEWKRVAQDYIEGYKRVLGNGSQ